MTQSLADQLMERRATLIIKAQEIAQRGVADDRDLTVEEQTAFDQMIAESSKLQERAQAVFDGEKGAQDLEASFRGIMGREPKGGGSDTGKQDSGLGKWARESRAGDVFTVDLESRAMQNETRDMSGTGGLGKDAVASTLWEYAVASNDILKYARLMTTSDGNTIPMPKATVHADPDATDLAPNDPIVEDDSTLTTVDLSVVKRGYITYVPNELLNDATFDVEGYIARNAGKQLGLNVAAAAVTAAIAGFTTAGTTTAAGVLLGLGTQSTAAQGSDYLIDLLHSVIAPYRSSPKAAWAMNDLAAAIVRKLKASTGDMIWQPSLTAGDPDMILGYPVCICLGFDNFAASKKPIFFGDWDALVVRIAGGLRFERSAEAGFGNDQTAFRSLVRRGAVALDPNAVKHLATPSS